MDSTGAFYSGYLISCVALTLSLSNKSFLCTLLGDRLGQILLKTAHFPSVTSGHAGLRVALDCHPLSLCQGMAVGQQAEPRSGLKRGMAGLSLV